VSVLSKGFHVSIATLVFAIGLIQISASAKAADPGRAGSPAHVKAVAFDYFVLFNPDSVIPEVERTFPGRGREVTTLWRTRQFEYAWLRSMMGSYADFFQVTGDSLQYAANSLKLELGAEDKRRILNAFLHLTPWPDAADALRQLKESGLRVVTLANFSPLMLKSNAENAGLIGFFDDLISTDANHTYKPDPRAYRLGIDHLHLAKQEVVFAAFGGWDAAGAKSFGYPTFWVNRFNQAVEELGVRPDGMSTNLDGLLQFVQARTPGTKSPH